MLQTVAADVTLTDSEADAATITTADVVSAITAACGSSFSYAAAVVSATADVETDAATSSFTLFPI